MISTGHIHQGAMWTLQFLMLASTMSQTPHLTNTCFCDGLGAVHLGGSGHLYSGYLSCHPQVTSAGQYLYLPT